MAPAGVYNRTLIAPCRCGPALLLLALAVLPCVHLAAMRVGAGSGRLRHTTSLRLRGGNYMDDVELLEDGLSARDIEKLHYEIGKDGASPQPPDYARRVGNISLFDEEGDLDEQGVTDGFPFDWSRWSLDARFHVGFRSPLKLELNRSIYATFEKGEMVVVKRPDGAQRFAQVLDKKSDGYFRGELQVGHQYRVLLEPTMPGSLPHDKILDAEDIGKLIAGWVSGRDSLDDACR